MFFWLPLYLEINTLMHSPLNLIKYLPCWLCFFYRDSQANLVAVWLSSQLSSSRFTKLQENLTINSWLCNHILFWQANSLTCCQGTDWKRIECAAALFDLWPLREFGEEVTTQLKTSHVALTSNLGCLLCAAWAFFHSVRLEQVIQHSPPRRASSTDPWCSGMLRKSMSGE